MLTKEMRAIAWLRIGYATVSNQLKPIAFEECWRHTYQQGNCQALVIMINRYALIRQSVAFACDK
jgi:hypothetical protein